MKKWLSLIVMTSLLLGATYLAVATEAGRNMLNSSATTRAMLAEIDAMLAKDSANPELLAKREEVVQTLAAAGEAVEPMTSNPEVKDAAYLRSIGAYEDAAAMEQIQADAQANYLEQLLAREREGLSLTESEKLDLLASGLLENDSRVGDRRDQLDNVGGPDGFGYRWVDNLAGDTATYAWEDIVGAPGAVNLTAIGNSDDAATSVPLTFSFPFYATSVTTIYPSTNGAIGMTSVGSLGNTCTLPTTTFPSGGIWPFWDDLHPGRGGTGVSATVSDSGSIWYKDEGTRVIVQWDSIGRFSPSFQATYSFQAILYADGKIKLQYKDITRYAPSTTLPTATIGIQQGSTAPNNNFLTYDCATVGSASQDTIRLRAVWFYQNFLPDDFACTAVLQPSPVRVSPSAAFNVVGRIINAGSTTQSSPVKYQFNGGAIVTEATAVLAQLATEDHDFAGTETAPGVVGDYPLLIWSDLAADGDRANDTARVTVQVRECADETQTDAFVDAGTTCGAINDFFNTCMGTADAGEDYIYQWVVTQTGNYNVRYITSASATLGMALSSSCPPDSFNCIASVNLFQDTVSFNCISLNAGTYYITLDRSTGCGTYTLQAGPCIDMGRCCYDNGNSCQDVALGTCTGLGGSWDSTKTCANNPCPLVLQGTDSCYNAPTLAIGQEINGTTVGFTIDTVATCGTTLSSSAGVWYKVIGTGDSLTVTTCFATGFDTKIGVFCGSCDGLTCVGGNDDATCTFSGLRSRVNWCSSNGTEYYILVTGFSTNTGAFGLIVNNNGPCLGVPINCTPFGRCCYLDNGAPACVDNLAADCATLNGQWNVTLSCASTPCPVGRCCYVSGGFGACETNTELECNVLNGTWTSTTTCEATPCPIGRCCYDDNGTPGCVNDIQEICTILDGVWDAAATCEANPCPLILQGSDLCADAVLIPAFGQQYVGTNVGATAEVGLPVCATPSPGWYNPLAPGVWYKVVGTGNTITITFCDPLTAYDTEVGVFCHPHCDSLVCVTSDDDFCTTPGLASQVTWCSTLGAEYKVLVAAFGTGTGTFAFTVTDDGVACVPTVVCPTAPAAPCDPVVDLAPYVATVGNVNDHLRIHFTAPQDETYFVWSTTNPNNDGNPDSGADPDWTLEATLPSLLAGAQTWDAPAGFPGTFKVYVVTADCPAP